MPHVQITLYTKTILFLSFLLFLEGYLFVNLLPVVTGIILVLFLVYVKTSFKQSRGTLQVNRTVMEPLHFVNHPINIKTTIKNTGGLVKISATDVMPEDTQLLNGSNKNERLVPSGGDITIDYQIQFSVRGNHTLETVTIEQCDRWGLYTTQMKHPCLTRIMVHSDPAEIQKAKRISTREHIEITMPSLHGIETTDEMEGIRDYIPGDRLKDIEWKATSRLQKLMTKQFQSKETVETILLLDCSKSMRHTTKTQSKLDHSITLAVHLTKILQSIRHPIGLIAYDEYTTLKHILPTNNYQTIFRELTDLPSHIKTTKYTPSEPPERVELTKQIPLKNQRFIATVFPFLTQGKRAVKHPLQATGIYEAIRHLLIDAKSKHLIILTDMETNIHSLYRSIALVHARKYKIWLLTSFSPYYALDKHALTPEQLEDMYKFAAAREKTLLNLKKLDVDIVELTPTLDGGRIIETIRRK